MAIVKMKKLRVIAMAAQREELLQGLLHLGCVEISEPKETLSDPELAARLKRNTADLTRTKSEITDANIALDAVRRYGDVKEGLFAPRHLISEQDFLSEQTIDKGRKASEKIGEYLQELSQLQGEESRLTARRAGLLPWEKLDAPLEQSGTAHTTFRLEVCPASTDISVVRSELAGKPVEIYEISEDRQQKYIFVICLKEEEDRVQEILRPHNFSVTSFQGIKGTAAENIAQLDAKIKQVQDEQTSVTASLQRSGQSRDTIRLYMDRLNSEAEKESCSENLVTDGTILVLEGWAPAERMNKVSAFLESSDCAWEASDPTEDDIPVVPIQLKNNALTKPLNMVTDMYSLPRYGTVDPNPLIMPFFVLFFGIMMADMAYGIIMIIMWWFMTKKAKLGGSMGNMGGLLGLCGVTTFIFGALTGGFLGDFIPQIARIINPAAYANAESWEPLYKPLFTAQNDTIAVLIGSLILGFIQVMTGMAISFYMKARDGHIMDGIWDEGSWWVIIIGAVMAVMGVGNISGVPIVLVLGIVMVIVGSGRNAKGFGKVIAPIGAAYNGVSGYFSDIMSYSRIMALMLSGSIIASAFNQLGAITNNVILFTIISLIGNTLNFALNLLGCYVHDLRLQCLEYFGRFYESGGKPFKPLAFQTKYMTIEEDK